MFYEKNLNKNNIENLLLARLNEGKTDLCMVSFRLCAKGYTEKCKIKTFEMLNEYIFNIDTNQEKYLLYIMGLAHRSEFVSNNVISILSSSFSAQRTKI